MSSDTFRILVGCWGKIGDIIHAMPVAQKLAESGVVHVAYAPGYSAVGGVLDLLEGISSHSEASLDYVASDLGVGDEWDRVVNTSHNGGRTDPMRDWDIFGWWADGAHAIDFAAAHAGLELKGADRYLDFKVQSGEITDTVIFLSNCGDPAMRGISAEWFPALELVVRELGGEPVECSVGPICTGSDMRGIPLGDVVRLISTARMVVSVDTLASALVSQSLDVPIVRLYRGATHDSMTGVTDVDWSGARWEIDRAHNEPPSQEKVIQHIRELWAWREERGSH